MAEPTPPVNLAQMGLSRVREAISRWTQVTMFQHSVVLHDGAALAISGADGKMWTDDDGDRHHRAV
jgi:hypothetical protein